MSAWVVEKGHIDVLVAAMIEYRVITPEQAVDTGRMLWRENHASVNFRYREKTRTPAYRHTAAREPLHPVAVLNALGCYEYQTCEHQGWDASEAKALCLRLNAAINVRQPDLFVKVVDTSMRTADGSPYMVEAYHTHTVYKASPWGFRSVTQAYASNYTEATS